MTHRKSMRRARDGEAGATLPESALENKNDDLASAIQKI